MKSLAYSFYGVNESVQRLIGSLLPISLLVGRVYVAWVFFKAGLTKIDDWGTTLFLFEEEYSVPLFSPEVAAFLATFGELVFPVLLVLGLFSLLSAAGLFVINIVAVISLEMIAPAAELYHVVWGLILLALAMCGPGLWSLDKAITSRLKRG
ncbi:DoxX family protein [Marinobacter sp. F4206]|uniref:DoxX family protein n=1 Tax=Marinobacter sp. F4206 TaxID=2861777 RepID=UPI001C5EE4A9|nr:DoxX family protein [Marinobacter sp. F4206]MBW4933140.1 DoxX family protein [Marinobacter sp. F4206]